MPTNLSSVLQELTAQQNTTYPFLSVYLNWVPEGNGQRSAPQMVEQELARIADSLPAHGPEAESFAADQQRIMDYINSGAPNDAKGLAIFACNAEHVWMTLPFQVPMEHEVVADCYPHVFQLARILDDYETFAVVLADGQDAQLFVVSLNDAEVAGTTEASETIKRFDDGGVAQMLLQRRTENLVKAHTKDIAAELSKIMKRYDVQHVIVSINDSVKGAIMDSLTDDIKAKLVETINLDKSSINVAEFMQAVEPIMQAVERQQESNDVTELENQTYDQGLGVVGLADTATALSKGQVQKLLMLQSFNGAGSECPNCGSLLPGSQPACPYDGAETHPVDLREVFTARAVRQNAAVQVVENSDYLDQHEGVGALLRYRDMEKISVA